VSFKREALRNELPLVTWLLPVRNGMPFLTDTLRSVAEQQYPRQRIIAWDNGSTDGTQAELRRWIPGRIDGEVIDDRPLRLGECRANLVERATSEICACTDADDISHPDRLMRQVHRLLDSPSLVAIGAVPNIIDEHGRPLPDWYYPLDNAEIRWRTRWQASLNASSVTFRRSAVLAAGNYRNLDLSQDLDLWIRLSRIGGMQNLSERLISYRRHTNNLTAGVVDYFRYDREIAVLNADALFPGYNAGEALTLWDIAYPRVASAKVRLSDIFQLRRTAIRAARAVGEPDRYFTGTAFFRRQVRYMLYNWTRDKLHLTRPT